MKDTFEFTLNSPLTEEQWDTITDVDFDRTDRITFHTKHGKEVEFMKIIRCKDCKHAKKIYTKNLPWLKQWEYSCAYFNTHSVMGDGFCSNAEPEFTEEARRQLDAWAERAWAEWKDKPKE